jgi:hypothetical protein
VPTRDPASGAPALATSPAGKVAAAGAKPARSEPAYPPASVLTNIGRYTFDTADPAEIARIEAILRSEPGLEQVRLTNR